MSGVSQGGGERRETAVAKVSQGGGERRETEVSEVSQGGGGRLRCLRGVGRTKTPVR